MCFPTFELTHLLERNILWGGADNANERGSTERKYVLVVPRVYVLFYWTDKEIMNTPVTFVLKRNTGI